jgi:hypothetical protein
VHLFPILLIVSLPHSILILLKLIVDFVNF